MMSGLMVKLKFGIDGEIEVCNPVTGEATNAIIRVQVKTTTQSFRAETKSAFEYICEDKDIEYWMRGNIHTILIVCRPSSNEAYWIDIKEHFSEPNVRKTRKILFDKDKHIFNVSSASAISKLALSKDTGFYSPPYPTIERLYTNLLKVASFYKKLWVASTDCREPKEVWEVFKSKQARAGSEWILKNKQIISFQDLEQSPFSEVCEQSPFSEVCDIGSIETFESTEWANSDDPEKLNDFIHLLNRCLKERTYRLGLHFHKSRKYYYFPATKNLKTRHIHYNSTRQRVHREVFKAYKRKGENTRVAYCRHAAFKSRFLKLDDAWFLEITPTYHFTNDGFIESMFRAEHTACLEQNIHKVLSGWSEIQLFLDIYLCGQNI